MSSSDGRPSGEVAALPQPSSSNKQQQQQQQQQQPQSISLYARKLLQKLSTLQPSASLESRQTIASWIIFNRKKCDGMGEGLLVSIKECSARSSDSSSGKSGDADANLARLMLLLRILHQVLTSNCPTTAVTEGNDVDTWNKSSQLRIRLGEIVILPLWKALAKALNRLNETNREVYQDEIGRMLEEWNDHNVFGGPTVWEEYKRAWNRSLKEASTTTILEKEGGLDGDESTTVMNSATKSITPEIATTSHEGDNDIGESAQQAEQAEAIADKIINKDEDERVDANSMTPDVVAETHDMKVDTDTGAVETTKRESVANIDAEVDFEGVDEANVEPSQFLDAFKVIASIQITRDLGSDAAMNLSSALSSIPSEVEEACNTILTQQQNGEDTMITPITELLSTESLSNIPDELLDLDINYVRHSLQTYKEAIRQQRTARVQLLQLLLQSRCSFGSMDAARAFCGGDDCDVSMDVILDKLKKRKETLVDAMALEGLDVEEDEEEKKLAKEEVELLPLSWFPGQEGGDNETEKEPADKRLKTS